MSCSNPMLAYKTGAVNPETGKPVYRFLKSLKNFHNLYPDIDVDQQMRDYGELAFSGITDFGSTVPSSPDSVPVGNLDGEFVGWRRRTTPLILLPCGQCLECRTRYAAQWADRIILEARYHEQSYFITLTYKDEFVPSVVDENGNTNYTLAPKHLQDFIKRFRRQQEYHVGVKLRFYAVGEYGSLRHRPHYHIIVFGAVLDDLRYIGQSKVGTPLHTSDTILELWHKQGRVEVEPLSWESACYTARYTVKKLGKAETDFYDKLGIVPEFTRMSLKPAIGAQYLEDNMERIYKSDEIIIPTTESVRHSKPPHYYDEKYDLLFPEQMADVKENRKDVATEALKLKLDRFSGSYLELLENQHQEFINRKPNVKRRNLE